MALFKFFLFALAFASCRAEYRPRSPSAFGKHAASSSSADATAHKYCTYKGKTYPHGPKLPVRGDTYTCYCNDGAWVGCVDNKPILPPFVTALEARSQFRSSDFVADLKNSPVQSSGKGGTIQPLSVEEFPALAGQGISFTLFTLEPCGINLPHVHPRATEMIYLLKGNRVRTAFVEENGGRTVVNDIDAGKVTFFPAGLVHYQQNLGCSPAQFLSALNSEDPGVLTVGNRLFTLPTEALQATFDLTARVVSEIKRGIPAGPAMGRAECLKRCGLFWQGPEAGAVAGGGGGSSDTHFPGGDF